MPYMAGDMANRPLLKVLIAAPRGFCAGVDRAIQIVELAIERSTPAQKPRGAAIRTLRGGRLAIRRRM